MTVRKGGAWAGWIGFAGTMLFLIGGMHIFEGMLALITDERVAVAADKLVLVDLTSWGWTLVVSGMVLIILAIGLAAGATWARFTAIVVVGLHAAAQVLWLGAYPIWSLLVIALDTVVLFALTARWSAIGTYDDGGAGAPGMPGDPLGGRLPHETAPYGPRLT
jgi:hypothetical protein